jgi:DNA repair protein RadC
MMTNENLNPVYTHQDTEDRTTPDFGRCPKLGELKVSYRRSVSRAKSAEPRPSLRTPELCSDYLRKIWDRDTLELREEVVLICLDSSLGANGWVKLFVGGLGECAFDIRLLFGVVLKTASSGFIVAHNHPSGNLTPSADDRSVTRRMAQAANFFGIRFVDHLITSSQGHYSFRMSEPELFISRDVVNDWSHRG